MRAVVLVPSWVQSDGHRCRIYGVDRHQRFCHRCRHCGSCTGLEISPRAALRTGLGFVDGTGILTWVERNELGDLLGKVRSED
jgi:hypothetical protein